MLAYYGDKISPHMTETPEGYLVCHSVRIARIGTMEYRAGELGLDGDTERRVRVARCADEVFSRAALASFEGKPVTDGHPPETVGPENFSAYAKGHVQNVRRDGAFVVADLHITDSLLRQEIQQNGKREISCGYECVYEPLKRGAYTQKRIRGNHIAVVTQGRAGSAVSIQDSAAQAAQTERGNYRMRNSKTERLLSLFSRAARDAEAEDLAYMAQDAATALQEIDAEKQSNMEELCARLSRLIGVLENVVAELPGTNDAREDKMGRAIRALERREEDFSDEDEECEDDMNRVVNAAENTENRNAENAKAESACAARLLRGARGAVAAIRDPKERRAVTDALLTAVRGTQTDAAAALMEVQASRRVRDDAPAQLTQAQNAYDARNPHAPKQ